MKLTRTTLLTAFAFACLFIAGNVCGQTPLARATDPAAELRGGKLTPGAVRRLAAGLLLGFGWSKPQPKTRGKSPGRAEGAAFEPRERFKAYRKTSK